MPFSSAQINRFWSKVKIAGPDECWEWQRSTTSNGYGHLTVNKQHQYAHRMSYEITNGPIPEGLDVLHTCDNPPCVNLAHLIAGTTFDNVQDMHQKGRARKAKGEQASHAKLTEEQVRFARFLFNSTPETINSLAHRFDVDWHTMQALLQGRTWKHVR